LIVLFVVVLWLALLLDFLFGDPECRLHPVRLLGWLCTRLENAARCCIRNERMAGIVTALTLLCCTFFVTNALLFLCRLISEWLLPAASAFLLYTTIAVRDLVSHANRVHEPLATVGQDEAAALQSARQRVAMLVGRETGNLDRNGIVRACVESVAESMGDGLVAPLFWATVGALAAGGGKYALPAAVSAAMLYRAANTMDSMFGYKNERYLRFGWFAAKLDDLVNLIPARTAGVALVVAALLLGNDWKNAWRILLRDHANHTSPNAGYPEAAMAGALGVQLGGANIYFGKEVVKPAIGDALTTLRPEHIKQANRLIIGGAIVCSAFFSLIAGCLL
jgi:adenosylcobinamide-phosphate synthase